MSITPGAEAPSCPRCAIERWTTRARRLRAAAAVLAVASTLGGGAAWRLDDGRTRLRSAIDAVRDAPLQSPQAREIVAAYSRCAVDDPNLPPQVELDTLGAIWQAEIRCASPAHAIALGGMVGGDGFFWEAHSGPLDMVYLKGAVAALARERLSGHEHHHENQMTDFLRDKLAVAEAREGWPARAAGGAVVALLLGALASAVGAWRTNQRVRQLRGATESEHGPYRAAARVACARHGA